MNLDRIKQAGLAATFESGRILRSKYGHISSITKKGRIDLVTEADTESEKAIIAIIRACFPNHSILAEESGRLLDDTRYQWIIDPLDGTTNFAHELPLFSTSIAFAMDGVIKVGIVHNPISGELFTAIHGEGAFFNGKKIAVSSQRSLSECLLVTGFPYNFKSVLGEVMPRFSKCLEASQGVRRLGSAALDLCFVACGRFDGFWEQNLSPWDTAAGLLISREAGAQVTDFSGNPFHIEMKELLATNGNIHGEMLSLVKL
ncbi:MAG: inositol monophosphatase [Proteobacteria bacterium]|nr:inositol monophosphatase [Pseudomonadota bacterium]